MNAEWIPEATIERRKWEARAAEIVERDVRYFKDCANGLSAEDFAQNVFDTLRNEGCPDRHAFDAYDHFLKLAKA